MNSVTDRLIDDVPAPAIKLCTLNARYSHASFGLRYLYANLAELQCQSAIEEFTLDHSPLQIAEELLKGNPKIIGFGVYIWNVEQSEKVVAIIKRIAPNIVIVFRWP